MYQCLCNTCKEDRMVDGIEEAQEYFNEHAGRGCEVEIVKADVADDQLTAEPTAPTASGSDAQSADEAASAEDTQPSDE
ncbi:hypothetical protein HUG10_15235 [Halorarum halophilum]|uniref:Uncharacterized protein n=1 Tax=Halorarum halophilum TaxID=2743090 RepID=A0A7D5GH13_9EURY|nr:hypothetical protein [Halobaculum halophilum]QLG28810.1 hypothetical protein HUG10_15235 [Halobaculum halophilum]